MVLIARRMNCLLMAAAWVAAGAAVPARGADAPVTIWNSNEKAAVTYQALTPGAKAGDWVYVDAATVHPTQFCLGYREMAYRGKTFSEMGADMASKDATASIYPYLAKKDVPMVVAPDGTAYITDGHHTLAGLLASTQKDKLAFGHVVANFYGQSAAKFAAFMTDPANNDTYLFGPTGNGLTGVPAAAEFAKLPRFLTGVNAAERMADDPYRSLTWAMKGSGYVTAKKVSGAEDPLDENFVEFRWADLLRGKILWDDKSDDSFYTAVANAEALTHSEGTTDITGGFAAADRPGFVAAKAGESYMLNVTNQTRIEGDIVPSSWSANRLAINADAGTALVIAGRLENLAEVRVNAGGTAAPVVEQGKLAVMVKIAAGAGTVILPAASGYKGPTLVHAGRLVVNGAIGRSDVTVEAGGMLSGSGRVDGISGGGVVSPGSAVGILTATAVDPSGGTQFAFELTAGGVPEWGHGLRSRNDVLRLTGSKPFAAALGSGNVVRVYLNAGVLKDGETLVGGFFADKGEALAAAVGRARLAYYVAESTGSEEFGGVKYVPLDEGRYGVSCQVKAVVADFGGGPVNGAVTEFVVRVKGLAGR